MENNSTDRRIGRLETQNRWLCLAVAALAFFGIVAAKDHPDVSRAESFQLTDEAGTVRAELGFKDGSPALMIRDENGVDRLMANHAADGTGLFLYDDTGTTRIGVAQFAHGGGGVALHGPESRGAAVLYFKGQGSLRFFDPDGNVTGQVPAPGREEE